MGKCDEILDLLKKDDVSKVVLVGKAGVGKTWVARQVAREICKPENGSCYLALWLHLNKKYDERSLYEDIAVQLSLLTPEYEETEEDDGKQKEAEEVENLEMLKKKIIEELEERRKLADGKRTEATAGEEKRSYLLLILDDEGRETVDDETKLTTEDRLMKTLKQENFLMPDHPLKILITKRHEDCSEGHVMKIEFLSEDDSRGLLMDESIGETRKINDPKLISGIVSRSKGLPAAIVVLAKSLKCSKALSQEQERVLKEAVLSSESFEEEAGSQSNVSGCRYNPILQLAYELLKNDDTLNRAIADCFWHCLDFFEHCGAAYYRDLITHWILEGYFDPVRSVEKAYQYGHSIFMELINRGILKIQDDNMVVPEMAMRDLIDLRDRGFLGASRLGFAKVYGGDKKKGVGRIAQIDDMIKTVQTKKKGEKHSTILISGSRLRRETPKSFFEKGAMWMDLEVLGLFAPTFESLVQHLAKLKNLRVLVIRDYDLLNNIDGLAVLDKLHLLEVSGASSLKEIRDDFFEKMSKLQSLNLSGLQIKSSPSSISKLLTLRSLILRDCPELEDLPDIQKLEELVVVDVCGARSLKSCSEKYRHINKSKNKNFAPLQQLQLLDLSESQIDRLPIFHDSKYKNLCSLTRLLLRNCSKLKRLTNLKPLSGLQILDLSGTTSLAEILEVCFEDKKELRILNLSGTNLSELPPFMTELSNLSQLLLMDCSELEALPNIEGLTRLEVFNVSGCSKLDKLEGSFECMSYLREVNLSRTKIETLPELPKQSNLHCSKRIVLADSRCLEGDDWSKIKEGLPSDMHEISASSDKPITPDAVTKAPEILEGERESGEKHSNESHASMCPEKKGECKELFHQADRSRALYLKTRQFDDLAPEPLEIRGCNDHVKEDLEKAEFVSFVDNCSTSLSSVVGAFQMKAVKGCWLERCKKMETVLSGECEKHVLSLVEPLETLWISNLPLLKSMCSESLKHGSFKNLKKLSLDCCPSIKTLFPASQVPESLEILRIQFCDQLEKVFDGDCQVPNLHTLHLLELPVLSALGAKLPNLVKYTREKCPEPKDEKENLNGKSDEVTLEPPCKNSDSDWVIVSHSETAP